MGNSKETVAHLRAENEGLRRQLEESSQTLDAIRSGEVDALVVEGAAGEQVFTLKSTDYAYRSLVENMSEGAATLNAKGIIVYCNKRLADMLQMPLERMVTLPFRPLVSPADYRVFDALYQKAGQQVSTGELNLITAKGSSIPVNLSLSFLKLEEMPVTVVIATDLTQRKMLDEIVAADQMSKSIIEQANEAILVCDEKGKIIRASIMTSQLCRVDPLFKQFEDTFRIRTIDSYGTSTTQSIDTGSLLHFNDLLKNPGVKHLKCTLTCPDTDKKLSLLLSSGPLRDANSRTIGCVIVLTDITELKHAEAQIIHLNHVLLALRNVNQLILKENDRDKLLKDACDNLIENRGYSTVWIALFDDAGKLLFTTESGLGKAFLPLLERLQHGELTECGRHVLRKPDLFIKDLSSACADCPLATTHFETVEMSARLEYGIKTYGMLTVSLPTKLTLNMEEQSLFQEIANDIAFGLYKIEMDEQRQRAQEELKNTVMGAIDTVAAMAEARDPYTAGHQRKVSILASAIAGEMGLSPEQIEKISVAGTLHDIGKVSVPSEILSKPGKLNQIEFDLIKDHPRVGANILKSMELPWDICPMVVQHHERMNGSGYPQGLSGQDIVLEARILAVADVVEAMNSHRPYRPALGIDKALDEITQNKGILYDSDVVDACLKLFNEKGFKFE